MKNKDVNTMSLTSHLMLSLSLSLGNEVVNSVWEVSVPPTGPKKPRAHDVYAVRDRFIREKYERRSFVAPLPISSSSSSSSSPSHVLEGELSSSVNMDTCTTAADGVAGSDEAEAQLSEDRSRGHMTPDELLRHSCETDDVIAALRSIAWGANICSAVRSPPPTSQLPPKKLSPPKAALPSVSAQDPLLLLAQPSADMAPKSSDESLIPKSDINSGDLTEWSPLLIAAYNGSCACVALLLLSGADPYHAASTLCAESGPSSGSSFKAESMPLMEIAGRAGHEQLVAYLHRKLDAMKAVVHGSPVASPASSSPVIETLSSSPVLDSLLKDDDCQKTSDPSPSKALTVTLPDEIISTPVAQKPVIKSLSNQRDLESTSEDELEDFYEALMSDIPSAKKVPR